MTCCKGQKTNNKIKNMLGGWSFEPEVYDFITANLPFGSTILELGSGAGTAWISGQTTAMSCGL
jgi:hypothetical protein